jgi:hypothetical protein
MTSVNRHQARACARRGWPVVPCLPGQKIHAHGRPHREAAGWPARPAAKTGAPRRITRQRCAGSQRKPDEP